MHIVESDRRPHLERMQRRRLATLALGLALVPAVLLGAAAVRARPIPAAPAHVWVAPTPEHGTIEACWLELARNEAPAFAGSAGFPDAPRWNVTVSSLLVRHPKGDLAIDIGNSSQFAAEVKGLPRYERTWLEQLPGSNRVVQRAPEALSRAGVDLGHLRVVLTHVHADHAGGLVDLPRVPALVADEEAAFASAHAEHTSIHVVPAHRRALEGRVEKIVFAKKPYATFDESADLFDDGSVVVVKLGGHTPGSVGVFVNVSPTLRIFHVGDAVNLREAIVKRRTKSVVMAASDVDRAAADATVAKLAQLHEADPALAMLPAHEREAWERALGAPDRCVRR